jgi:hypothetical protein
MPQGRLGWIVAAAVAATAPRAHADSSSRNKDAVLAETLFREGRALLESGQTSKACVKLTESYRLDARTGTLMNAAACHEMEGKLATAWAEFLEAARLARARGGAEGAKLEETAKARAAQLEPRMHRVLLVIADPASDLSIRLDERDLPAAAWSTRMPVDDGAHVLEARRPDHASYQYRFDTRGPGESTVKIPSLVPTPDEAKPPLAPSGEASSPLSRPVFWGAAAVAVIAAGVGTIYGVQAIDAKNERDGDCNAAGCSASGIAKQNDAFGAATASTVFFTVGSVAAIVAIVALAWPSSGVRTAQLSGLAF